MLEVKRKDPVVSRALIYVEPNGFFHSGRMMHGVVVVLLYLLAWLYKVLF